ncbi:hypothetical protein RJT34_26396 [Clitoria ternatea]|uniref:non-specific serine/threonine protein kinase n=1 Tax=Clitoria ternatea TaxID=43366 RepID=A0AAN9I7Z7_CLITE
MVDNILIFYAAQDCHSTSTLTEGNDIYDFGLLIMDIVSGRNPLYHSQPQDHIVEWFKSMISNGKIAYVVDPKLPEMPSSKELKHVILVALRCVDPDVNPTIKMGDVVCMLETNLLLSKACFIEPNVIVLRSEKRSE